MSVETPKNSILIVDDTPDNLTVLTRILTQQGYTVRPAINGEIALHSTQELLPDLVLLDIMMPGLSGYEVCRRLKADERTREIPIIFISARDQISDKVTAFSLGGVDYITKPFRTEEVVARVQTHLKLRNLQQQLQEQNARLQHEIGVRRQAEQELKALNQELQKANASKDKLFSIIAHDLRSPFASLMGFSELVINCIDDYTREEILENMIMIKKSSDSVYALLENLLAWSRLQQGIMKQQKTEIFINRIVENNAHLFLTHAEQKQITLKNAIPQPLKAYADYHMIDTVIRNLISNALKFTDHGGTITLSAHRNEREVEIAIADTGIGMSEEDLAKLFQIDDKFTTEGTEGERGTGLGLGLCKELVEKNDGKIWVESTPGRGSTFRFSLPCQPASQEHPPAQPAPLQPQDAQAAVVPAQQPLYRVLIVDDRPDDRHVFTRALSPFHVELREAANGQEAVDLWHYWNPQVIFMDVRMPILNGYDTAKHIKATAKGQRTVIIAVTVGSYEEEYAVALSAGCDDFLRKPFQETEVLAVLQKHFGEHFSAD
jgi:CheY-like chemotaxis protein